MECPICGTPDKPKMNSYWKSKVDKIKLEYYNKLKKFWHDNYDELSEDKESSDMIRNEIQNILSELTGEKNE